jgi:Domain of Unknown Function (DUF1259)
MEGVLGVKGQLANGVYRVTIGRTTTRHGPEVGNTVGVNTWAACAGSETDALVEGDGVLYAPAGQPGLRAVRAAGRTIVAIHHPRLEDPPRTVFLHDWGVGPTRALAQGLTAALAPHTRDP